MPEFAPRRFRFVVFDWDGTLADSTAIIAGALQPACRDIGEPVPDDADRALRDRPRPRRRAAARRAAACRRSATPNCRRAIAHHYLARDPTIPLFAGARELLAELDAAGYLLGVATGKTRVGLDRALAQQRHRRTISSRRAAPTRAFRSRIRTCCCT